MESNIINAEVVDVINGNYILNAANGMSYELPSGAVEVKNGQLVCIEANQYLKLVLPNDEENTHAPKDNDLEQEQSNTGDSTEYNSEKIINTKAEWPDKSTKLLIELYREKKELVEQRKIKTLKRMWLIIEDCINRHGYNYTAAQCENKWKTLERAFKNKIENNTKTGRGRKACAYERELSDILLDRVSVIPPAVMDSKRVKYGEEMREKLGIEIPESEENADTPQLGTPTSESVSKDVVLPTTPSTSAIRNTPRSRSVATKELINLRKAIEKRTEEKKIADDRKYEQREKMLNQLERRNELLEKLIAQQNKT